MVQVGKDITWQDSLILENEVSVLNNVLYADLTGVFLVVGCTLFISLVNCLSEILLEALCIKVELHWRLLFIIEVPSWLISFSTVPISLSLKGKSVNQRKYEGIERLPRYHLVEYRRSRNIISSETKMDIRKYHRYRDSIDLDPRSFLVALTWV